jgi:hypothetical protein
MMQTGVYIISETDTVVQDCGAGLIQSGSVKFLNTDPDPQNPDPMRIWIHKGKFEDNFFSKF